MNINMNQYWNTMNKYERTATQFLWGDCSHRSILNKLDSLKAMAALGDGVKFTLRDIGMGKAAASLTRMRLHGKDCPFKAVGREEYQVTVKVFDHYADPFNRDYTIIYQDKEITASRLVYKLVWTADEVNEFVDTLAQLLRVNMEGV